MLEDVEINQQQQPTMLNLDSGQVETVHEHAWDRDLNEWLDNLIEELDQEAELESFENDIDFTDSIEDMTNDEWGNVWNDVINNFHSNLFRHFFSPRCILFFRETTTTCVHFFLKKVFNKITSLQFQTFLGLHDSFHHTLCHGFLPG